MDRLWITGVQTDAVGRTRAARPRWRCWCWWPGRMWNRPRARTGATGGGASPGGVAPDRVISTVDPEARHTRKSPSQRKDGYRAHVVAEPDTGLITDETLTMAAGADNADAAVAASFLTTTTGEQAATEDATEDAPEDATTGEPRSSGEWQPVLETMQLTRCGRCLRQGMVRFSLAGVLMFCHRAVQAGPSPDGWCGCWCLGDGGWLGLGCCGSCRCHGGCF